MEELAESKKKIELGKSAQLFQEMYFLYLSNMYRRKYIHPFIHEVCCNPEKRCSF